MNEDKLREKWEAKLKKHGLGTDQPMTDNSEGEMADLAPLRGTDDFAKLRKRMDGSDPFMEGHQIVKVRKRTREIPEWALDDNEVRKVLLTAFPNLKTDETQRKGAARWMRIIHLYYRMGQPHQIVAKELGVRIETLKPTIRSITRVSQGRNARSGRKRAFPLTVGLVRETGERNETVNRASLHKPGKGR